MRYPLFLIVLLNSIVFYASAQKSAYTYKISGTINGFSGQKVYLEQLYLSKIVVLDSTFINKKDKSFSFSGSVPEPVLYRVRVGTSANNSFLVALDKPINNISFSGDSITIPEFKYKVTGSVSSDQLRSQIVNAIATYKIISTLDNQLSVGTNLNEKDHKDIQSQRDNLNDTYINNLYKFIDTVSSPIAKIFCTISLLGADDHLEQWKKVDAQLKTKAYAFTLAKEFSQQIKDIETQMQMQVPPQGIAMGSEVPDIALADTSGKILSLSSLRGKYVLIDFWASWCGPCRIENPNVVKAYQMYKDKGFTIFSVSLDQDITRWKKAILADKLSWPYHVSELKGWGSKVCQDFNIYSIPNNYFIDPQGKVIATGLRGDGLLKTLEQYVK